MFSIKEKMKSIVLICLVVVAAVYAAPNGDDATSRIAKLKADFKTEDCEKWVEDGPMSCFAHMPVYHWNHETKKCEQAVYGGCHASRNNFKSLGDCEQVAQTLCQTPA